MKILSFVLKSILFGAALAVDAFSVSVANAVSDSGMSKKRGCFIAGLFGFFQTLMPIIGWICVRCAAQVFTSFEKRIPWIAAALLFFIGIKMIVEGFSGGGEEGSAAATMAELLAQGLATSLDALSVGFTIAGLSPAEAVAESVIIGVVTFFICLGGLFMGKRIGAHFKGRASVAGGIILLIIGGQMLI